MLKNQNPVTMWVPETTRATASQIAQLSDRPQHQVVTEALERELKRVERQQQKGGQGRG